MVGAGAVAGAAPAERRRPRSDYAVITMLASFGGPLMVIALVNAATRAGSRERARALVARRPSVVPPRLLARVDRALQAAGIDISPERALQIWLGAAGMAGVLAMSIASSLVLPAVALALAGGPIAVRVSRSRQHRALDAALPGALDMAAAELRAGGTVRSAVVSLARTRGPLAADLSRVDARVVLGTTFSDALERWAVERGGDTVRAVAGALAVADSLGGRAVDALEGLARSLRDADGAAAEARALSSQARLSAMVVGAAPFAYLAFQLVTDPASTGVLVGTPAGQGCLAAGLVLEAFAVVWMRRIVGAVR
jgi:tight adherence protein B